MKNIFQNNNISAKPLSKIYKLIIVMVVVLIIGGLYIRITPPWWHHDESGHFQVAWFYSVYGRFPTWEEYDPGMRRELAISMEANRFYEFRNYKLDLNSETAPWVQSPQFKDPKLPNLIYAIAFLFANSVDSLEPLLYLGRIISLIYLLLTAWVSWLIAVEIFSKKSNIPWMSAVFIGLLPGSINQMTAFSNEPLGTLLFSAFVLFSLRLLKTKRLDGNLIFMLIAAFGGIFTTKLVWIPIALLIPFVFLIKLSSIKIAIRVYAIIILVIGISVVQFTDAKYWYTQNVNIPMNITKIVEKSPDSFVDDEHAVVLSAGSWLTQRIPKSETQGLENNVLLVRFTGRSIGEPISDKLTNILSFNYGTLDEIKINVGQEPQIFYSYLTLPDKVGNLKINLKLRKIFDESQLVIDDVFVIPVRTGIVLENANIGNANSNLNLVRNSSFENNWPTIKPSVLLIIDSIFPEYKVTSAHVTLFDIRSSIWYFKNTIKSLIETFFGKVGASNFEIFDWYIYVVCAYILIIGILSSIYSIFFESQSIDNKTIFVYFALVLLIVWAQVVLRGIGSLDSTKIITPWARYGIVSFPIIGVIFSSGYERLRKHFSLSEKYSNFIFIALFLSLNYFFILKSLEIFYL